MNLFEFENQQFGDLWNDETIKELKEYPKPERICNSEIVDEDEDENNSYLEFQEANWYEYFDWAKSYRYVLWY